MCKRIFLAILFLSVCIPHCYAQYREYHVVGKVVDKDQNPIPGVDIKIRDEDTTRGYAAKTDAKGAFEFVGIPHGIYGYTVKKSGYESKSDKWKFEQQQERMQTVTIPAIVLLTEGQVTDIAITKELQAGVGKATEKMKAEDFDGALGILGPLLDKKPDDTNLLYLKGLCLMKKGSTQEAADMFARVLLANTSFAPAYLQLGICYQKANDLERALGAYRKTLELDPQNLAAAYNAGTVLYTQNKPGEAIVFLEKAAQLKQDDPDIFETLAYCQLQLGDNKKSLENFERALPLIKDPAKRSLIEEAISKLKEGGK